MTATLQSIKADRAQTEARLAALRAQRGAAVADGEEFADAELLHLERLCAALDDAQGAIVTRQREQTTTEIAAATERLKGELFRLEGKRLEAIAAAEKHCRGLVAALAETLEMSAEMRSTCKRGRFPAPMQLSEINTVSRLGMHMSAVLRTIPGHPARFGSVNWHATPKSPGDDWAEHEQRASQGALKHATEPRGTTDL